MTPLNTIVVCKKNESSLYISAEQSILFEMSDFFCFYVPGYKHMPKYKSRQWDGKIRLFNAREQSLPQGLFSALKEFAEVRGYNIRPERTDYYGFPGEENALEISDVEEFISEHCKISSRGTIIKPHDYQLDAVCSAINKKGRMLLSPTASGKSLIIYLLTRMMLQIERKSVLIVVPTTSLVEQMNGDFNDYSEFDESFNASELCHLIYSGKEKHKIDKPIVITTWQSVYKMPAKWFNRFGMVIGDEAHGFKAESLTNIMAKSTEAEYRIGLTGTLDGTKTHQMVLEGLFGPVHKVISTKELMDRGAVSDLEIKALVLEYSEAERIAVSRGTNKMDYQSEIKFIIRHERRNNFIKNLAADLEGNTLILYNRVDTHGKPLFNLIHDQLKASDPDRKVFFISGGVDVDDREAARAIVEKEKDAIIVASLGTFSTGINIRNLHNVIFASPSKSQIKVLQSIGRGLRKSDDGRHMELYDLIDDLHWKNRKNYALDHGAERMKIYIKEQFKYKVIPVSISK